MSEARSGRSPWIALILGIALATLTLILGWLNIENRTAEDTRFAQNGIETTATVIRKDLVSRGASQTKAKYDVTVRYDDADGRSFAATNWVSRDYFERISVGDEVEFVYLPTEPREWRLEGARDAMDWPLFGGLALIFLAIGGYMFVSERRRLSPAGQADAEERARIRASLAEHKARWAEDEKK